MSGVILTLMFASLSSFQLLEKLFTLRTFYAFYSLAGEILFIIRYLFITAIGLA